MGNAHSTGNCYHSPELPGVCHAHMMAPKQNTGVPVENTVEPVENTGVPVENTVEPVKDLPDEPMTNPGENSIISLEEKKEKKILESASLVIEYHVFCRLEEYMKRQGSSVVPAPKTFVDLMKFMEYNGHIQIVMLVAMHWISLDLLKWIVTDHREYTVGTKSQNVDDIKSSTIQYLYTAACNTKFYEGTPLENETYAIDCMKIIYIPFAGEDNSNRPGKLPLDAALNKDYYKLAKWIRGLNGNANLRV
jgi:hypothetical protein